jgi:pyridoxal phosphate enzyme (YggS family)
MVATPIIACGSQTGFTHSKNSDINSWKRRGKMVRENVKRILEELPPGVELVGAAKTRTPAEVLEAVEAGLRIIGHNYVQEAEKAFEVVGAKAKWHMIGHLQSNKANKAVRIFDMIETVDSAKLARAIDKACEKTGKVMPILIEINSGEEPQKAGVMPADAVALVKEISELRNIRIMGLMTMGPFAGDPEDARPYFQKTRRVFDEIKRLNISGVEMMYLSMGMSNSYRIAIEEGANMVRIGTALFGERG